MFAADVVNQIARVASSTDKFGLTTFAEDAHLMYVRFFEAQQFPNSQQNFSFWFFSSTFYLFYTSLTMIWSIFFTAEDPTCFT